MTKPRLLLANVHYEPWSYGGGTIVVQAMATRLARDHGWQVLVVTTFQDHTIAAYTSKRYRVNGVDVVAVCLPPDLTYRERFANPRFDEAFERIVTAFDPQVAHVHCVQNMGATFFRHLDSRNIPFAVTVHDAWWWCERQFMVMENGSYCHQVKVNYTVCGFCIPDVRMTVSRRDLLFQELLKARLILFPSDYFRDLGVANGMPALRCRTNKNGVLPPGKDYRRTGRPELRFGFVGGPGPNKGSKQILEAFRALDRTDYELVIVDAAQNVGRTWRHEIDWTVPGRLRFHPGYTVKTIDDFFGSIDVLLFPSLWKESFGLTVREALIRDVWVIASDAGGVAEDCAPGVNSTVIPMSTDPTGLTLALKRMLDEPLRLGYENPRKAQIVTNDDQARELSNMLKELLGGDVGVSRVA